MKTVTNKVKYERNVLHPTSYAVEYDDGSSVEVTRKEFERTQVGDTTGKTTWQERAIAREPLWLVI